MTFQPVVPGSGLVGWQFLQRTYDAQFKAFSAAPKLARDAEYFLENIAKINSARDLVGDRRLLSVALGAFGLQADVDNRFFIQKVLQDGTASDDALASKLADSRYRNLSEAFRFGPGETRTTGDRSAMADIVNRYRTESFEASVGEQDETMRIALYAQRELEQLARSEMSDKAKWFNLMGLPPLRTMFETALGLPETLVGIDIDKQQEIFSERTRALLGESTVSQFLDQEKLDRLTTLYLARSQITQLDVANASRANALALLSGP